MNDKKNLFIDIKFNDPDDYAPDTIICMYCGSESDERIGYNEKKDLLKRACSNCGLIYVEDGQGEITILKGEKRDWTAFLSQNLKFPFEAEVENVDDDDFGLFSRAKPGIYRNKDRVTVLNIDFEDDVYGIIVKIKKGNKKQFFPLDDLRAVDIETKNYKLVDDYKTWFENFR